MQVKVEAVVEIIVDLPITNFSEIMEDNMPITDSNKLIINEIDKILYNHAIGDLITLKEILGVNEIQNK